MSARAKAQNPEPLSGHIEAEEMFVVGRKKRSHRNRAVDGQQDGVFGIVQRGGILRAQVVAKQGRQTLMPLI